MEKINFDPLKHNLHKILNEVVSSNDNIYSGEPNQVYLIYPYIIHRKPIKVNPLRTFIRISFTPIEIRDKNNTINGAFPKMIYTEDRVKTFRNNLI